MSSSVAEAPGPASEPSGALVLAGSRTMRPDILNRFKKYRGGWDITNKHYWASVGFTGAAALIIAVIWFVFFGLAMITHHYCGWRIDIKGKESQRSQMICLVLLIVFTLAAATGCIHLSVGQDEFHTLEQLSGYKPSDLKECVQVLHDLQLSRRAAALVAIREKYKQHKFKCVSELSSPSEIPDSLFEDFKELGGEPPIGSYSSRFGSYGSGGGYGRGSGGGGGYGASGYGGYGGGPGGGGYEPRGGYEPGPGAGSGYGGAAGPYGGRPGYDGGVGAGGGHYHPYGR